MSTISRPNEIESVLESRTLKEMQRRMLKDFLDMIIMTKLRNSERLGGYEIMELIYHKFGFLVSPGTVYSLLYAMERRGLIRGEGTDGKRTYALTDQGKGTIDIINKSKEELLTFMRILLDSW